MDTNTQVFQDITPDMIQAWKAKYGNLKQISITDKDKNAYNYIICRPTRTVIDALGQYSIEKNVMAANKVLVSNCVLGGDMAALEKGDVYSMVLDSLNKQKEDLVVEIKNI